MDSLMKGSVRQLFRRSGDRKLLPVAEEIRRLAVAVREGHLSEPSRTARGR